MSDRRCTAKSSRTGRPCGNRPIVGGTVCHKHGGRAPQVKAAAARRVAEAEADKRIARVVAHLDVKPVEDPLTELSMLAGQVLAWRNVCAHMVNQLTGQVADGETSSEGEGGLRYTAPGAGTEQLRAEVALFERALDRCAGVLGMIAKLNIDDRLAKISERQTAAVVRAIEAAITELGGAGVEAEGARRAAARELRLVK